MSAWRQTILQVICVAKNWTNWLFVSNTHFGSVLALLIAVLVFLTRRHFVATILSFEPFCSIREGLGLQPRLLKNAISDDSWSYLFRSFLQILCIYWVWFSIATVTDPESLAAAVADETLRVVDELSSPTRTNPITAIHARVRTLLHCMNKEFAT